CFFFQAEDGIRDLTVTGVQTCALPIFAGRRPAGYLTEARSHNAVAAAVAQGRADWGVAIQNVAQAAGVAFIPLQAEEYDFVLPRSEERRVGKGGRCGGSNGSSTRASD